MEFGGNHGLQPCTVVGSFSGVFTGSVHEVPHQFHMLAPTIWMVMHGNRACMHLVDKTRNMTHPDCVTPRFSMNFDSL